MSETDRRIARGFDSDPGSPKRARVFVVAELRNLRAGLETINDFGLIVSELVANSVQYGDGGEVFVTVEVVEDGFFAVSVANGLADSTPPLDPSTWIIASSDRGSGRGLGIVSSLADEVTVEANAHRVTITCLHQ